MMETKWTPGPWKTVKAYGHEPEHIFWDVTPKDSGWKSVATVWCSKDSDSRITREAMDANAHLIAAAPELYEALEACLDELMTVYHSEFDGVWVATDFAKAEAPYKTALAKARGE